MTRNIAIPHGDVKKRGSLPAQTVYAWLLISLDLRDKAVQARRRHNLTSNPDLDAGEETEDEEIDAYGDDES
jgi:hypothetical protein